MIPAVILAVVLTTPTFSLPLSTQDFITAGNQDPQTVLGSTGHVNLPVVTGEKSQVGGVSQTVAGTNEGSFIEAPGTKTGTEEATSGVTQAAENIEKQSYSELGESVQPVTTGVYSGAPVEYSGVKTVPQGIQVPPASHQYSENYPQNTPVPKREQAEHNQPSHSENPVLLPVQPLTIVPVTQVGELLQPVIVPAEALTAGRLIIMTINPIQKRSFQDVSVTPEKQVPYQQVTQPATYSSEQVQEAQQTVPVYVQPIEKQQVETGAPTYSPVQHQFNPESSVKEQLVSNVAQQAVEPVQNYSPVPVPQVYNVVNDYVEKQVPQQSTAYTPVETSALQQQTYNVQQPSEREYQQGVQTSHQQQDDQGVQLHQPYQSQAQKQSSDTSYQQHQVIGDQQYNERQAQYQQNEYVPVQHQPLVHQVYNVQPDNQQSYVPVEPQPVQQKVSNGHPEYQENYTPVQPQSVVETQTVYQPGVQQAQSIRIDQDFDVHPEEPNQQQQVSNIQSFASNQANTVVGPEFGEYVPQAVQKASEQHSNQQVVVGVRPEQAVNYAAEQVYSFGDKIPQNPSAQHSGCHQ